MTLHMSPFGERSLTVVAASFADRQAAELAARTLTQDNPALEGEVTVIPPGDPLLDRKLEPEQAGIWRTLVRSHLVFGVAGGLVGMVAGLIAIVAWPAAALAPVYTILFTGAFGAFFGLIGAGLLTLRPDHGYVIRKVQEFSAHGRWAVIARPLNEACSKAAYATLMNLGSGAVRSF
ncbi:MAG: hypothetical protein ABI574_12835 [Burkholderiales bacterium]